MPEATKNEAPAVASRHHGNAGVGVSGVAIVVVCCLLGVAGALAVNVLTVRQYASEAVVRVYNPYRPSGAEFGPVDVSTITNLELVYAQSPGVSEAADREMSPDGHTYGDVQWTPQTQAGTLTVRCLARRALDAAACARALSRVYVDRRASQSTQSLDRQIAQVSDSLDDLVEQEQALERGAGSGNAEASASRVRLSQIEALLGQISDLRSARQTLRTQARAVGQNYEIVRPAETPSSPAVPVVRRNLAVGGVVGLLVGLFLLAVLRRPRASSPARPQAPVA